MHFWGTFIQILKFLIRIWYICHCKDRYICLISPEQGKWICIGKYLLLYYFHLFCPTQSMGKFFPFITPEQKHKYIWTNLPGKTGRMIRWCKRAKITLGKDNPVYLQWCSYEDVIQRSTVQTSKSQLHFCTKARLSVCLSVCFRVV